MLGKSLLVFSALALAAVPATADARNRGGDHHSGFGKHHGDGDRWSGHRGQGRHWSAHRWSRDRDYGRHHRRHYRGYGNYYGGYYGGYYGAPYYGGYYNSGYGYYGAPYYYAPPYYGGYYGAPVVTIRIGDNGRRRYYRRYR